jgi:hypothetical protein
MCDIARVDLENCLSVVVGGIFGKNASSTDRLTICLALTTSRSAPLSRGETVILTWSHRAHAGAFSMGPALDKSSVRKFEFTHSLAHSLQNSFVAFFFLSSPYLCLSAPLCLPLSLSVSACYCLSAPLSLSLSLLLSVSLCLSLSLPAIASLLLSRSLSLYLSMALVPLPLCCVGRIWIASFSIAGKIDLSIFNGILT